MPKVVDKEDIDNLKTKLYYKIFDVYEINDTKYYLDKEFNLIWDCNQDVVGIINNNKPEFFTDLDSIINNIHNNNNFF